jgi:hypothetical protein
MAPTRWVETTTSVPCPACGHSRHCTISDDGKFCICRRGVVSQRPCKQRDDSIAYFHAVDQLSGNGAVIAGKIGKAKPARARLTTPELTLVIKGLQSSLSPDRLAKLAASLGVSERSLKSYGVGYDVSDGAATFPMYDGDRKPIGVRLRHVDGRKTCVPGSQNGLFLPDEIRRDGLKSLPDLLTSDDAPLLLLTPEGPTDCCAAADLGFRAIGRPSNSGGASHLAKLLRIGGNQDVIIVADRDETKRLPDGTPFWPGIEGALSIAEMILPVCKSLKLVKPPERAKDLRAWIRSDAATTDVLVDLIENAETINAAWLAEQRANLLDCKRRLKRTKSPQNDGFPEITGFDGQPPTS